MVGANIVRIGNSNQQGFRCRMHVCAFPFRMALFISRQNFLVDGCVGRLFRLAVRRYETALIWGRRRLVSIRLAANRCRGRTLRGRDLRTLRRGAPALQIQPVHLYIPEHVLGAKAFRSKILEDCEAVPAV
jgi:hypothetical protein